MWSELLTLSRVGNPHLGDGLMEGLCWQRPFLLALASTPHWLAESALGLGFRQFTWPLPLSSPHVRCCLRSQWRDRKGVDSSFFSHSRRAGVDMAASEWGGGRMGAGGTCCLRRGACSPPSGLFLGPPKDNYTQTLSTISIFSEVCVITFGTIPVANIVFPVPFYYFLSTLSKYRISSVFRVSAPKFPLRKFLNWLHIHTHTRLHENWK